MSFTVITLLGLGLAVILAALVALLGVVSALTQDSNLDERIQAFAYLPEEAGQQGGRRKNRRLFRLRSRLNTMLSMLDSDELNLQLLSANWPISVSEYILIRFGVGFVGLLAGWLLSGFWISGGAVALIAYLIPGIYLNRSIHRRRMDFERQLIDILVLITGAVRAGFSLLQAIEVVEREMRPPASDEFRRVRREVGLGLSIEQALTNLASRMQNDDLSLAVTAIKINYQVGGNMTTMLEAVTDTIRERTRLFSEVRVLTTQQRYTTYLLTLLPFFVGALLFLLNPEYMSRIFEPGLICIPIGSVIGIVLGNYVIRRMARIEV